MKSESKDEETFYELLEKGTKPYIQNMSKEKRGIVRELHRRAAQIAAQSEELSDEEFRKQVDEAINRYLNKSSGITETVRYTNFDGIYLAFIIETLSGLRKDFQPLQPYVS